MRKANKDTVKTISIFWFIPGRDKRKELIEFSKTLMTEEKDKFTNVKVMRCANNLMFIATTQWPYDPRQNIHVNVAAFPHQQRLIVCDGLAKIVDKFYQFCIVDDKGKIFPVNTLMRVRGSSSKK